MKKMLFVAMTFVAAMNSGELTVSDTGACEQCGQSLSQAFINVAKKCRPAVVHIRVESGNGQGNVFGDSGNPF